MPITLPAIRPAAILQCCGTRQRSSAARGVCADLRCGRSRGEDEGGARTIGQAREAFLNDSEIGGNGEAAMYKKSGIFARRSKTAKADSRSAGLELVRPADSHSEIDGCSVGRDRRNREDDNDSARSLGCLHIATSLNRSATVRTTGHSNSFPFELDCCKVVEAWRHS
jgi:hypothetical protein